MLSAKEEGMQLYATIRKQSKYSNQQEFGLKKKPIPFKVKLDFTDPYWPVKGGPGGNYTLYDVDLWVKCEDKLLKTPMHQRP
ncbi:MAG: hypothetical protein EHM79_02090 [Geobacter sp.]|nr:MAG: hypothetical protein EHM79_02090 [Geobacter sp.]